jgi:hypothetical protein
MTIMQSFSSDEDKQYKRDEGLTKPSGLSFGNCYCGKRALTQI